MHLFSLSIFLPLLFLSIIGLRPCTDRSSPFSIRQQRHGEHVEPRQDEEAYERALGFLSPYVRRDLEGRDASEYELAYEHFLPHDAADDEEKANEEGNEEAEDDDDEDLSLLLGRDHDSVPRSNHRYCSVTRSVAMTYDDGPYIYTRTLAEKFANASMQISYFINVQNWACAFDAPHPENLQYALSLGHVIGSHSATHPDFQTLSWEEIDEQIERVEDFCWQTLGLVPRLFRPPFGSTNTSINRHLARRWGLTVVTWIVNSFDAEGATPSESIEDITAAQPGNIILAHETHATSANEVTDAVIANWTQSNVRSENMEDCLQLGSAYKVRLLDRTTRVRDDSWKCA